MPESKTLFQKIADREIPADLLFEDDCYVAFRDVDPQAPVHVLVVPRRPIPSLGDLAEGDAELVGGMFLVAGRVMAELGETDYRTVFNNGPAAGQTVPHLHLHVLAGRPLRWPPG